MSPVICLLIFISAILLVLLIDKRDIKKVRSKPGVFGYQIFYTDQKNVKRKDGIIYSKLLYSEAYDLNGKPDYIYKKFGGGRLMPVELKSGSIGNSDMPHQGDLMQLVAYFLIIEDIYGKRPKYGRLVYKDYMFIVKNTKKRRGALLTIAAEMREMLVTGEGEANPSFVTCRYCVCKNTVCEYCERK